MAKPEKNLDQQNYRLLTQEDLDEIRDTIPLPHEDPPEVVLRHGIMDLVRLAEDVGLHPRRVDEVLHRILDERVDMTRRRTFKVSE